MALLITGYPGNVRFLNLSKKKNPRLIVASIFFPKALYPKNCDTLISMLDWINIHINIFNSPFTVKYVFLYFSKEVGAYLLNLLHIAYPRRLGVPPSWWLRKKFYVSLATTLFVAKYFLWISQSQRNNFSIN